MVHVPYLDGNRVGYMAPFLRSFAPGAIHTLPRRIGQLKNLRLSTFRFLAQISDLDKRTSRVPTSSFGVLRGRT